MTLAPIDLILLAAYALAFWSAPYAEIVLGLPKKELALILGGNGAVSGFVGVILGGWMADRFGTRTVFAAAIALFTLGSVLCGLATNIDMLVACRILQGAGVAAHQVGGARRGLQDGLHLGACSFDRHRLAGQQGLLQRVQGALQLQDPGMGEGNGGHGHHS